MSLIIVSGMSGAGKSSVMKILEDDGYYCVDNLPVSLLTHFLKRVDNAVPDKIAVGIDIRMIGTVGSSSVGEAVGVIDEFISQGSSIDILFLDASTQVLVKRYKETRRIHPIFALNKTKDRVGERVEAAIEEEREILKPIRDRSDVIVDTSSLLIRDLKAEIDRLYMAGEENQNFYLTFVSFGYKYGIPTDADLVFDVRFLPNPYYVEELKPLTGDDKKVSDYVLADEDADIFLNKLTDLIDFLIPRYRIEGKTGLVMAIGCTGGKHRSVTLTNALYERYADGVYGSKKFHRDIDKDSKRGK